MFFFNKESHDVRKSVSSFDTFDPQKELTREEPNTSIVYKESVPSENADNPTPLEIKREHANFMENVFAAHRVAGVTAD